MYVIEEITLHAGMHHIAMHHLAMHHTRERHQPTSSPHEPAPQPVTNELSPRARLPPPPMTQAPEPRSYIPSVHAPPPFIPINHPTPHETYIPRELVISMPIIYLRTPISVPPSPYPWIFPPPGDWLVPSSDKRVFALHLKLACIPPRFLPLRFFI